MSQKAFLGFVGFAGALIILLIGTFVFVEKVPDGQVAVVYSPSGGAKKVLEPGWHLIKPFESTTKYNTKIQVFKDKVTTATSDGKSISTPISLEYKVDASKALEIFKELGSQDIQQIQEGWLYQKLFRSSRNVISDFTVLEIYGSKASEASDKIGEKMIDEVGDLGFIVTDVTLGTPALDEETERAIDARVKASQENELKKQELENERLEAEKKKVVAEGERDKKLIEAKAEKEANELLSKSITPEIIEMELAKARNKHGWVEVQSSDGVIVDTTKQEKKKSDK